MSVECGICESDARRGHLPDCPRYDPSQENCTCDPEWQPDCTVHNGSKGAGSP